MARAAGPVAVALLALRCSSAAVALAADGPGAAPVEGNASRRLAVDYHEDRLSVRAAGVPLGDVLEAIEAEAGLRFHGEPSDQRDVWKRFDDVPLAEALRRVIGRQNFTLIYGDDGAPRSVELLGAPQPPPARPATQVARPSFQVQLLREPPVAVSARLAAALRTGRTIPLTQLSSALRVADPGVRQDAVDALMSALRRSGALRAAFVALSGVQLAALVRGWAGPYAKEVLRAVAERAPYADVRTVTQRALGRLQS